MLLSGTSYPSETIELGPSALTDGSVAAAITSARTFRALGFPEQALRTLHAGLTIYPDEPLLWQELFSHFMSVELFFSAQAIRQQLESMGAADLVTPEAREALHPYSIYPSISLYITTHNSEASAVAAVTAALTQSYGASQVIIVDDASTDATTTLLSRLPRIQLVQHPTTQGKAAARRTALSLVRGDLTASLDSSVVADKFWLERLLIAMIRHPIVGAFGPVGERYTAGLPNEWRSRVMPLQRQENEEVDDTVPLGGNSLFMTEALRCANAREIKNLDLLDERLLGKQLREAGFKIRYVAQARCQSTRKDTMQSALIHRFLDDSPRIRSADAYRTEAMLIFRWQSLISDSLREMERINASGTRRLLFPTFLSIFWTTICDLREFLIERDTPTRRIWCADVLAELRAVVNDKVAKSSELLDGIMLHIQPALESLPSEILSMGWYRDPAIPLTTRYISDFRLTLDFPRDVLAALGQGAADTITTDADSAIDTHRVAVLDVAYLLHWRNRNAASETIGVDENVVAELCLYRVRVETFDASRAFISEFQLALALREYAPVEIILNASGVQDTNVSFALLLLGEWWEDLPAITICDPPKGLSVDKGIVVSREDATGVLRSMLLCQ